MTSGLAAVRICLVASSMTLILPGCSTQSSRIGANDGSDVCYRQRVTLDSTGDYFGEDILKGAAVGAAGGALAGLLVGGNARGALIGAAAGGALGAAGGYWKARQQQNQDQASLYRTVSSDIERDNAMIDKTQLAFNQLTDCRQQEANRIKADYRSGRLTRPQADALMTDVRRRSNDDLQIARATDQRIQGRSADFQFANNQVNPGAARTASVASNTRRPTRTGQSAAPSGTAASVQAATSTNLAKRDQFSRSIEQAQARQTAFELS